MLWWFARFPEYIACTAVMIAIVGYAWLTIEMSGEAAAGSADGGRDEPSLW